MFFRKEKEIARNQRFFKAIRNNEIDNVKRLINRGFDVNEPEVNNMFKDTPLFIACSKRHIGIVETLLDHGADVNATMFNGGTILHSLPWQHNEDIHIWQLLLDHGADVNAADKDGWTPMHEACYNALVDTVYFLLQHGAQPGIKATDGQTALDITVALTRSSERREEILTVFQQFAPEFYFSHFCTSAMAPGGI